MEGNKAYVSKLTKLGRLDGLKKHDTDFIVAQVEAPVMDKLSMELVEAGEAKNTAISGPDREGDRFQSIEDGDGGDAN